MSDIPDFPLGLRHALESGDCILFLGAGIGWNMVDDEGNPAPDGKQLARELCSEFSIDTESDNLAKISQVVELRKGRSSLETYLKKRLANLQPDKNLKWLATRRWKAIFTTNYDHSVQRAYELCAKPIQKPITISINNEFSSYNRQFEVPIYHLHGTLYGVETPHILITENDYALFREQRSMLFNILKAEFATTTFLYIGYSNLDQNWNILLTELKTEFFPSEIPFSYRVAPSTDPLDSEILKKKDRIETIDTDLEGFVQLSESVLKESAGDIVLAGKFRSKIPAVFLSEFEKNPAAMVRLFSSWEYVNCASFNETPNVRNFLRGDKPNWSLIGSNQHFVRDVEEDIFDDLLDFATQEKSKVDVNILLGSAGYGTTTLLMSLAAKTVYERAGDVFMLRPGAMVIEGDVEYAASISTDSTFFFVDNFVENATKIRIAIHHLRERKISGLFMLGARLNEWRQSFVTIRGKEHQIGYLSDAEIDRLINCLEKHSELGILEPLDSELRYTAIKTKYQKELLVVLREATEGKSFDAILESEFRAIGNQISKDVYLCVCCLYQHGAYVRDGLLAQLMKMELTKLYEDTKESLSGVVIFDCIDEMRGLYAARARHRKIAAIVWERCCEKSQQDFILPHTIKSLNITYPTDKLAFESLIMSDRMVDSISSMEGKTDFFESACRKDPFNPYVRQHYARMLSRENKAELALSQIEIALESKESKRIFYHTKGHILAKLVHDLESDELARRRLAQSEVSFRSGITMAPKDNYCYEGLARLYLVWAKRPGISQQESAEYISKAEGIIVDGLRVVRKRDSLWIASSDIQKFLGDSPAHLCALEKAIADSPKNVVARYLLGKTYRKQGEYEKAISTLKPTIKEQPDEFRSVVEYAFSLVYLNRPYREIIAVLNLSTLYGMSDPRFIALLGGAYFLNGDFDEAETVFSKASTRPFSSSELNKIEFTPPDQKKLNQEMKLEGKVISVKAGFSMIESIGFPHFLCPGSKFGKTLMEVGLQLTFVPAFCAKRPLAIKPVPHQE